MAENYSQIFAVTEPGGHLQSNQRSDWMAIGVSWLVDGRYALAATAEERMAIAVTAALHSYVVQHPEGLTPTQRFLGEYLKPFLERELLETRLDELHRLSHFGERERELLDSRHCKLRECVDRIQDGEPT